MEWSQLLACAFLAGIVAGFVNPTIGNGNLFTLVVLTTVLGVPVLTAHVANQIGAPASFVAFWRRRPAGQPGGITAWMTVAAVVGIVAGAAFLSQVPAEWVHDAAPWGVTLSAVLLLTYPLAAHHTVRWRLPALAVAGAYGGLVGSGVRTLVFAALETGKAPMLAAANVLCLRMSLVSSCLLMAAGASNPHLVNWPLAGALAAGMLVGGIPAAQVVKHLPSTPSAVYWTRASVACATLSAAAFMFSESVRTAVLACAGLVATAGVVAIARELPHHHGAPGHP